MILHIFNDQIKFSKDYFKMLKEYDFNIEQMELIHHGKKDDYFENEIGIKTLFIRSFVSVLGNIKMLPKLIAADKIVVHSLASPALLLYLSFSKKLQKKVTWVIWGKDLYFYQLIENKAIYHHIYEWFRKRSFKHIGVIVTILKGDFERLKQWYDVTGENIVCNNIYHCDIDEVIEEIHENKKDKYTVLLGNSGSKTNRHIDAIDKLKGCSNLDKIYCPLSYGGNEKYYDKVKEYGKSVFGDKFVPLTDFVPRDEYSKMLSQVDIGIFNYNRQEGLGNIWRLMFMGKTVYINTDNSTSEFFDELGIKYVDFTNGLNNKSLEMFSKQILDSNQKLLSERINIEASVEKWREILNK